MLYGPDLRPFFIIFHIVEIHQYRSSNIWIVYHPHFSESFILGVKLKWDFWRLLIKGYRVQALNS
jgi:hypothetical protein